MTAKPQRMVPPPADDEDDDVEVTRQSLHARRRAEQEQARKDHKQAMTRRSWYTTKAAADAFQAAVDDIHHATRVDKQEVIAALMHAAVAHAGDVEQDLRARVAPVRHLAQ